MKTTAFFLTLLLGVCSFTFLSAQTTTSGIETQKAQISKMLDDFNTAAANAEFDVYFDYFTEDATFIGTDATEIWDKKSYQEWAKPYFDAKTTWDFTSLKRNIYFTQDLKMAWFDELLDTQMKICRGSGVLENVNGTWKVRQYVLSMTVPNEVIDSVIEAKTPIEEAMITELTKNK